jgi:outer membrane protein
MRQTARLLILSAFIFPGFIFAQPMKPMGDSLGIDEAVTIALEHQPSIRISGANREAAQAGLTIARSNYFPQIVGTATVTHTDGAFVFNPTVQPNNQRYNSYTTGVAASQTLVDFGKMVSKVMAGSDLVDAAVYDDYATRQSVIMNVRVGYYGLMQAEQVVTADQEAVDKAAEHLKQAKAFYTVGKRAQFDVTKAEVDHANARVLLIKAKNQAQIARLQLEDAMGIQRAPAFSVTSEFPVEPFMLPLDSVRAAARVRRPELLAAAARVQASKALVTAAWTQHLPNVVASGAYNWSNFNFPLLSRWNLGVTLTFPIFQGFATQAGVDQARANEETAQSTYDLLDESIMLEVEQYFLNLKAAEEEIVATDKLVEQAGQSLTLAEKQYAAGVGGSVEVTDARLTLAEARITRIQSLYDYSTSLVRLRKAMGDLK